MSLTSSTSVNTYRVGDFVYFDDQTATDAPYQIRKIDELLKSEKGVEARCVVYLRRRDIPQHLLKIADQAKRRFDNYYEVDKKTPEGFTQKGFIVANGGGTADGEVKDDEIEVDGDDQPPKIDAEESVAPAAVNAGRTSSGEGPEDSGKGENGKDAAEAEAVKLIDWGDGGLPLGVEDITDEQRLRLRQHEVFMTRQSEILPASLIRGKCRVVLLGDCETADIYLPHEDTFYHSLVYDPSAQTLLADKGAIRVGEKYQADVEDWLEPAEREKKERLELELMELENKKKKEKEENDRIQQENVENGSNGKESEIENEEKEKSEEKMEEAKEEKMEVKEEEPKEEEKVKPSIINGERDISIWQPYHGLLEREIDQYLIIARSVGLFARAIDGASAPKLPTLQLAAAFASRDITVLHAHGILHQANYDVGQAVKYLVPVASRESYPCQVDDAIGVQTTTLGGPILCRDQLEEWSTPEMNLFEDALDKCGKDFSEIRSDYLPWKSVRDIVEYYYLMKASNRYSDRKKTKGSSGSEDTKLTQVYIPSFNKAIPANIGGFNTSQNLTRSEIACENCGTLDAINWYQWGGVEKKVLCSVCWSKWKKMAGLTEKHELERFDKTRPPVLDQQTSAGPNSNGNDKPPVLQVQQRQNLNQQSRAVLQDPHAKANLYNVAKQALNKGQITQEQFNQLTINFLQGVAPLPKIHPPTPASVQNANATATAVVAQTQPQKVDSATLIQIARQQMQKKPAAPATKPAIVFYTTICRRAVRRLLPKSAFNLRRLSRKPFCNIDDEAILKAVIMMDKASLLRSAQLAAGEKISSIVEADFYKGVTHLQHTLSQATTGKRTASTVLPGEPVSKMARLPFQSGPSCYPTVGTSSIVPPTLEDVGNSLLAVNEALKSGKPYVNQPTPSSLLRFPQPHSLNIQNSSSQFRVPATPLRFHQHQPQQLPQTTATNTSIATACSDKTTSRERLKKIWKTPTDSRWFTVGNDTIKFRVGPQLKIKRQQSMTRHQVRRIARDPSRDHEFLKMLRPIIHQFFLEPLYPSSSSSSSQHSSLQH